MPERAIAEIIEEGQGNARLAIACELVARNDRDEVDASIQGPRAAGFDQITFAGPARTGGKWVIARSVANKAGGCVCEIHVEVDLKSTYTIDSGIAIPTTDDRVSFTGS